MRGKYYYKKLMKRGIIKIDQEDGVWYAWTRYNANLNAKYRITEKFAKYYFARIL